MPDGRLETIAEIKRILGEVKRTRRPSAPAVPEAPEVEEPRLTGIQRRLAGGKTVFLTPDVARSMGMEVDIDPDWMLKIVPGRDGEEPAFSYVSPERKEVPEKDILLTPEGRWITRAAAEAEAREPEGMPVPERIRAETAEAQRLEIEQAFSRVFPELDVWETLTEISISDEMPVPERIRAEETQEAFFESIYSKGRTAESEGLLRALLPGVTDEDLDRFFAPLEEEMIPPSLTEMAVQAFKETPWGAKPTEPAFWEKGWEKGFPGLMDLMEWMAPTKMGAGLGVVGAYIEKYVGRPWEMALMEASGRAMSVLGLATEADKEFLAYLDSAFERYGPAAFFSEEVSNAWEIVHRSAEKYGKGYEYAVTAMEWVNPAYLIPIGGAFGLAARFTSRIPLIGKGLKFTAAGVRSVERGVTYPVAKPLEVGIKYTGKGLEKIGVRLGEKVANQIIERSENLLLEIPESEALLKGALVDNWMKRALTIASKVPPLRAGIEKGLGWRILLKREGQAVEDIVARSALVHAEISRMGINAKAPKVWELRYIESDPVRYFGFNKKAYSQKMAKRLLPDYIAEEEFAGTLEHIFIHPEMYSWKGMQRGLDYVTKVHEINTEILNLLKKEGVPPANVTEDWWIHRVVEGSLDPEGELIALRGRPGVKGARRVGAKPSYEMHRKAPTMAEGIAWGVQYARNPELAISSYIEGAFKKIADARVVKYLEPFGVLPAERLAERFPEIVERAALTKTELADAAKFQSIINRAIRGEKIPEQTLRAMERRFPEMGKRFRALAERPATAENQLRELLAQNDRLIRSLKARLEKAEAIDIEVIKAQAREEAVRVGIPDEQKLAEAFRLMDYEDRLAFRDTMGAQLTDIGETSLRFQEEIAGMKEVLTLDPIAQKRILIGQKKVGTGATARMVDDYRGLDFFIGLKEQTFPEYFTVKQAQALYPGQPFSKYTQKGLKTYNKVPKDEALDQLTKELKMSPDEIAESVMRLRVKRADIKDVEHIVSVYQSRNNDIKRMLGVLDNVDSTQVPTLKPEPVVPKAEIGMPEAGIQKDIFGYETPVFPKGKGVTTQMSMDDYAKLAETWKKAGLPDDALPVAFRPKIEGVKGLEAESQVVRVTYEPPPVKTGVDRKAGLEALRNEARALTEARKAPYWQARAERAFRMEQVRQPGIGEGYIMQPFAGGRIYEQPFIDSFNKFFGHEAGLGVLKVTSDIAGILRITKAALDLSAMAIQGMPSWGLAHAYLMFNPVKGAKMMGEWYKAFFHSSRAFFDPGVAAGYMGKNSPLALNRIGFGGSSRAVDYFQALGVRTGVGGRGEWLMGKIPLKPYHRAETSFFLAGEMVRDEFWRILSPKAISKGQGFELARLLDRMTGIIDPASLGVPMTVRQMEQTFMWFAPSYTRACLTVLADIFRGGYTGAQARAALGGMIAAGSMMYSGIQYAVSTIEGKSHEEAWESVKEGFCVYEDPITGEVEWKPSVRFMTLKIGNYNFGIGGFWYGLLRLGGNIRACVNEVGEREPIDLVRIMKNGSFNKKDNPFIYWWYSRSSPFFGSIFEMATGKDFLGYPIETQEEYAKYIMTRFEPIWMEQGLNWMVPGMARDNEIPEDMARAALIPAEIFGLRTFSESTWTDFYDKADEAIKQIPFDELDDKQKEAFRAGELTWKELTEFQKADLISRYPELEALFGEAQADSAIRNSPHWKAYSGRMDEERTIYYDRIQQLTDSLIKGEIDTREYREKAGEAGQNYGSIMEAVARDPNYAEIYDFFDKKEAEGDKYGFRDDIALGEFQTQVLYTEDLVDSKGDYDWDERDRRVDAFIEKWGQDTYDRIQQYLTQKKGLNGLPEAWIRKAEDTEKLGRSYWRLPYKPYLDMDEEDMLSGDLPESMWGLWKEYESLETDEEREQFKIDHPEMAKDWRADFRKENPEADARLALWGYGGRLQTPEAYDLVIKWGKELRIPLEQMGLGIPPRSLMSQYFEYVGIARETSGNSIEARLYRLEHPDWQAWAEENWGWKEVSDDAETLRLRIAVAPLQVKYDELPQGKDRFIFRYENPDFERYLVEVKGYTPVGDRWK